MTDPFAPKYYVDPLDRETACFQVCIHIRQSFGLCSDDTNDDVDEENKIKRLAVGYAFRDAEEVHSISLALQKHVVPEFVAKVRSVWGDDITRISADECPSTAEGSELEIQIFDYEGNDVPDTHNRLKLRQR